MYAITLLGKGKRVSSRLFTHSEMEIYNNTTPTDHLKLKIIIEDETLEQVSQLTYLGCSISYQFSNDVEFTLTKLLQLIGTIKRTILIK